MVEKGTPFLSLVDGDGDPGGGLQKQGAAGDFILVLVVVRFPPFLPFFQQLSRQVVKVGFIDPTRATVPETNFHQGRGRDRGHLFQILVPDMVGWRLRHVQ
jgi:hypothetical protein